MLYISVLIWELFTYFTSMSWFGHYLLPCFYVLIWALFTYFTSLSWFEHYSHALLLCLDLSTVYILYFYVLIWALFTCFTSMSWFEHCLHALLDFTGPVWEQLLHRQSRSRAKYCVWFLEDDSTVQGQGRCHGMSTHWDGTGKSK